MKLWRLQNSPFRNTPPLESTPVANRLEALRVFCTAAAAANFREAAARLSVSPQVVTRAVRELEEELGIKTRIPCLAPLTFASHTYETFHLLMPLYICRRFEGIPTGREGQAIKWVRPKALRDYPMPPADEPLIPILQDLL